MGRHHYCMCHHQHRRKLDGVGAALRFAGLPAVPLGACTHSGDSRAHVAFRRLGLDLGRSLPEPASAAVRVRAHGSHMGERSPGELVGWPVEQRQRLIRGDGWQTVLYLARKLGDDLPHPLGELVRVRGEGQLRWREPSPKQGSWPCRTAVPQRCPSGMQWAACRQSSQKALPSRPTSSFISELAARHAVFVAHATAMN